jgi:hypothetical protein
VARKNRAVDRTLIGAGSSWADLRGGRVTRRLGKNFAQILEKVAKTVTKPKKAKMSSSKHNVKVHNINIKPF